MPSNHPVHFHVEPPARLARIHVLIRLALLVALGVIGCSSVYWLLYLALPALAAAYVLQKGGERYLTEAAPRIVPVLRWLAGAYAYLWLLTDVLPMSDRGGPVELEVEVGGTPPTPASALARVLASLPALLFAALLSLAAGIVWLAAAIAILVSERMPHALGDFLAMTLRYQARLLAYHLSLVERYPSLEASSSSAVHAPA